MMSFVFISTLVETRFLLLLWLSRMTSFMSSCYFLGGHNQCDRSFVPLHIGARLSALACC